MKKKIIALLCFCSIMVTVFAAPAMAAEKWVDIYLNGEKQATQGMIVNERTLLPIRDMCNMFDLRIDYDNNTKKITVYVDKDVYIFTIGSKAVTCNGKPAESLDTVPVLYNNRTYLPARYVSELVGAEINWNTKTRCVELFVDEFTVENGVLVKYSGNSLKVDLSKRTDIKEIGEKVFWNCDLTEVKLPESLTKIGYGALYGNEFVSIRIPDNVSTMEGWAVNNCRYLQKIHLPDNLIKIENEAFCYTGIKELVVPAKVTTIGNEIFRTDSLGNGTPIQTIVLPPGVVNISEYAFNYCNDLVIMGIEGSYAQTYADNHGFTFKAITEAQLAEKLANR